MENEIRTAPAFRGYFEESFWTRSNVKGNKPLTIQHTLPSFMALGLGLVPSIIIFILELLPCLKKERIDVEPIPEDIVPDESGTRTSRRVNVMDQDKNDIIVVLAEIQDSLTRNE